MLPFMSNIGVDYIQEAFAHISFFWKWVPMLFAELEYFTYLLNPLLSEVREFDDNSFQLHCLEFLEIDVPNSFVPQLYVRVDLRPFTYMADFTLFESRMNIRPSLRPQAMNWPSFSMMPCMPTPRFS